MTGSSQSNDLNAKQANRIALGACLPLRFLFSDSQQRTTRSQYAKQNLTDPSCFMSYGTSSVWIASAFAYIFRHRNSVHLMLSCNCSMHSIGSLHNVPPRYGLLMTPNSSKQFGMRAEAYMIYLQLGNLTQSSAVLRTLATPTVNAG